ncbi:MAG: ribosomal protein S18-alanine N-acetyltransferase [Pseudomonadota bacterium]
MIWFPRRKADIFVMKAELEDCGRLAEIHAACFSKAWDEQEIERLAAMPGAALWTAKLRGRGSAGAQGFVLVRNSGQEAEIITIATDPSQRRHGVGRALMEHVVRELHRDRVKSLFLEVDANNRAAISLYNSLGFKQVGTRKAYYSLAEEDYDADQRSKPGSSPQGSDALVMSLDLR